MTRVGMIVLVTQPPGMPPEQVCREVRACISFGQPEVHFTHLEEDPPDRDAEHPGSG